MNKNFIIIIFLILEKGLLFAQNPIFNNSISWEIKKCEDCPSSYLIGTVHVIDTNRISFPTEKLLKLLDSCKVLCVETDLSSDSSNYDNVNKVMFLNEGKNRITQSLTDDYLEKLYCIIDSSKTLKGSRKYLDKINPAYLGFLIVMEAQLSDTSYFNKFNFSPDLFFYEHAKLKDYKIIGLETVASQLNAIAVPDFSYQKRIDILKRYIDEYYSGEHIDMFDSYINQDLNILSDKEINDSIMVISRNQNMAEKIDNLLNSGTQLFIVVGLAHLPYKDGILNILSQKGYLIEPYMVDLKKKL